MRYIYLGKRIRLSTVLPVFVYLWAVFSGHATALSAAAAILIHEAGHITSGLFLRRRISAVTLSALGADIVYTGAVSYKADLLIAFAGPLFSLTAGLLFYRLFPLLSVISAAYGLLNLIPVPCFDGGRMLKSALYSCTDISVSDRICDITSVFFLLIMYLFSVFVLFYTSFNASLLLICAYIFVKSYMQMGK